MTKKREVLLLLLLMSTLYAAPAHAETAPPASVAAVYLDNQQLQLEAQPMLVNGTVLVPMRQLFEQQGAKLSWNSATKTVSATKGDMALTYQVGEPTAYINGQSTGLTVPGVISQGYTMMPLRFFSEAMGSTVKWDAKTRTVHIFSAIDYATMVLSGVNLRSTPDSTSDSTSLQMLPAGEKVHVIQEVGAFWLEVRTRDNKTGYISAKSKYSDYRSASLVERQADELIAYGEKFLGTPYEFGASTDQTDTFDCSSFVRHLFLNKLSIDLPRVSYNQAKEGQEVGLNDLRKGDLLFFSARGLDIGHVAIYAGDNKLLHTYSKELGVHVGNFDGQWKKRFVTARRVL